MVTDQVRVCCPAALARSSLLTPCFKHFICWKTSGFNFKFKHLCQNFKAAQFH